MLVSPGHSTPSNEPITTVDSNQEFLPNIVPFENEGGKTHPMQAFQGTTDTSDDVSPLLSHFVVEVRLPVSMLFTAGFSCQYFCRCTFSWRKTANPVARKLVVL